MLQPDHTALLIIDVQGNLAHAMDQKESLFRNLSILIRGVQILQIPIILTEQIPEKLGATIPEIAQWLPNVPPIPKKSFSCYGDEQFRNTLARLSRTHILIAGIESHVCVYQTVADLIDQGYHVQVVADAVSSRTAQNRAIGLDRMKATGATLTSTESALFELLGVAEGPAFKEIIKIVK